MPVCPEVVVLRGSNEEPGGFDSHNFDTSSIVGTPYSRYVRTDGGRADKMLAAASYWMPRSVSCLGLASSTATRLWQVVQSIVIDLPSLALWLPSWQRKQPG